MEGVMSDYLLQNSYGIYPFRMAVPRRKRPPLGKREVKRALKTKNHAKAARLARRYATFLELIFFAQNVVTKADQTAVIHAISTIKLN